MFSLEQLLTAVPPISLPGNHSQVAEEFRGIALHRLAIVRLMSDCLDKILRESPDDDVAFDRAATSLVEATYDAGMMVEAFRVTRDVQGEA